MPPAIQQHVEFSVSPNALFELYLNSRKHAVATGAPAKLSRKIGGAWQAYGGMIGGRNLLIVPGRLIVQSWRAKFWKKGDVSILVLKFARTRSGTGVDLVHVEVPSYDQKGVRGGWPKYYWRPWKRYLASQKSKKKK
ncbi:MAG TPA: SRPBCC domain-containing protein [Candidatus Acidoferrum sp.]|nr:SRPBCC domain-containing protein [Candidatus Acidoferrum sp.]